MANNCGARGFYFYLNDDGTPGVIAAFEPITMNDDGTFIFDGYNIDLHDFEAEKCGSEFTLKAHYYPEDDHLGRWIKGRDQWWQDDDMSKWVCWMNDNDTPNYSIDVTSDPCSTVTGDPTGMSS
jgi:hypothetical protein